MPLSRSQVVLVNFHCVSPIRSSKE